MGRVAIQAIQNDEELELVGEGRSKDDVIFLIESYYPDVVLDLTTAAVVFENTSTIIKSGVHPVIGTSGLLKEQFETLSQLCSKSNLGGVIVMVQCQMEFSVYCVSYKLATCLRTLDTAWDLPHRA